LHSMSQGHCKEERVDAKKTRIEEEGCKFKKQNAIQAKHMPQHQTPAVSGLIPFGKINTKGAGHMEGSQTELCHWGVAVADVQKLRTTARKDMLKELEVKRLMDAGVPQQEAETLGKKHFKALSGFQFKLSDD